ncbi:MAG: molybdopterin-dependent oxidoreductase, partial [Actinomycetota bacterium]|nr:molybdopterin-dependent oxidoreductase [Actinomycetota bacterium]
WADLVLPATSYLEREGTLVNLEGRLQRLRPAANPPGPDELAWLARLGERFGVELSPYATHVFGELGAKAYGGIRFSDVAERAALPPRTAARDITVPATPEAGTVGGGPLQLVRYRALFSGPAVERVGALQFQRPAAELELSPEDASVRGVASGDSVRVSSNGTSVDLRAVLNRQLKSGVVRAAEEHVRALRAGVEVTRSSGNRSREAEVSR